MPDDTATPAPLSAEATPAVELLLAAIYACAAQLDKDELTDDAGEPLRVIGNELEDILDLDVKLDQNALFERGEEYAETSIGLAHAVEHHIMPTTVVRDRIYDVDLAGVLASHRTKGIEVDAEGVRHVWCVCGWDTTEEPAHTAREQHIAAALCAALLGEAAQ